MNNRLSRWISSLGPLIGLVFVVGLFSLSNEVRPYFLTGGNFKIILTQTVIVAVGALGMTLIIVSGGIDLSVGSLVALTSVVAARIVLGMAATDFTPADFRDRPALFSRLKSPADPVARFVAEKLSEDGRKELAGDAAAVGAVARDLNALVAGPALQEGGRFQGTTLRSETQRLLARKVLSRDAQARLNRRLLEDAFPSELVPLRPAWLVTVTATVVTIAVGGMVGWINGMTIAVFRMMEGDFQFADSDRGLYGGRRRLFCEMTLLGGKVMWDWNGRTGVDYRTMGPTYGVRAGEAVVLPPEKRQK